jgi:hypothetical protein
MTADADRQLDEPSDQWFGWCLDHGALRPCEHCRDEAADRALQDRLEERKC